MKWDHVERVAKVVTLAGALVGLVGWGVSRASSESVSAVKGDVAVLKAMLPSIDHKLDILIETEGQREWRDHRVIIPMPSGTDGGAR